MSSASRVIANACWVLGAMLIGMSSMFAAVMWRLPLWGQILVMFVGVPLAVLPFTYLVRWAFNLGDDE